MRPVWESPAPSTFDKKIGYLYNCRLDFMYNPALLPSTVTTTHNVQIFIVKIVNFSRQAASGSTGGSRRPGAANWTTGDDTILDDSGDIAGGNLTRDCHYSSGVGDDGAVTLSPKYFNVLHKFNLAANPRSINLGALPGNQTINWHVNIPLGRMKLERYSEWEQSNPVDIPDEGLWPGITQPMIDPYKQVHLLVFTNSACRTTTPFGGHNLRPLLSVRKTLTFGTSLD